MVVGPEGGGLLLGSDLEFEVNAGDVGLDGTDGHPHVLRQGFIRRSGTDTPGPPLVY